MDTKNICRCPRRPESTPGSFASGSAWEVQQMQKWTAEHGDHPYVRARDELASAMQRAESLLGSGDAMWQAAHEIMGLAYAPKPETEPDNRWMTTPSTDALEQAIRNAEAAVGPCSRDNRGAGDALFAVKMQLENARRLLPMYLLQMPGPGLVQVKTDAKGGLSIEFNDGQPSGA